MEQRGPNAETALFSKEAERLALSAIDLARASILAENHFLASALARLQARPAKLDVAYATDGYVLAYDCDRVLDSFKRMRGPAEHDLLHSIVHCLFLHPYAGDVDPAAWNLACDIACERVVAELLGPRSGDRGIALTRLVRKAQGDLGSRADAERLYKELCRGRWEQESASWEALAHSDSHELWYAEADTDCDYAADAVNSREPTGSGSNPRRSSTEPSAGNETSGQGQNEDLDRASDPEDERLPSESVARGGANAQSGIGAAASAQSGTELPPSQTRSRGEAHGTQSATPSGTRPLPPPSSQSQQRDEWSDEAMSMAVNLQTLSAGKGGRLIEFLADLQGSLRKADDYAGFLRSFAAMGEVMRLSDDEFDYNFYDLGMRLYGNMPLIEPLEYREERRIRDFVIVIDTSQSVQGQAVRSFVQTTFDLLKGSESFFDTVHVRVLQCDDRILSDDVIVDVDAMDAWMRDFTIRGGGGTDFRPAFEYVEDLRDAGRLRSVDGLLYFTDGLGVYPQKAPPYKTAFVFYDEELAAGDVPPWAMRVVLDDGALRQARDRATHALG